MVVKCCCFSIRQEIGEYFISLPGWPGVSCCQDERPLVRKHISHLSFSLEQGWLRQAPDSDWYMARVGLGCAPRSQRGAPGVPMEAEAQTETESNPLTSAMSNLRAGTPHVAVRGCPLHSRSWEFRLRKIQTTTPSLVPECLWTIFEALLPPTDYPSKGNMLVTHSQALHHYLVFILLHVR